MVLAALVAGFGVALPTEGEHGVALLAAESQTQLVVKWPKGQEDAPTVCAHQLPLNWCGAWLDDQGIDGKFVRNSDPAQNKTCGPNEMYLSNFQNPMVRDDANKKVYLAYAKDKNPENGKPMKYFADLESTLQTVRPADFFMSDLRYPDQLIFDPPMLLESFDLTKSPYPDGYSKCVKFLDGTEKCYKDKKKKEAEAQSHHEVMVRIFAAPDVNNPEGSQTANVVDLLETSWGETGPGVWKQFPVGRLVSKIEFDCPLPMPTKKKEKKVKKVKNPTTGALEDVEYWVDVEDDEEEHEDELWAEDDEDDEDSASPLESLGKGKTPKVKKVKKPKKQKRSACLNQLAAANFCWIELPGLIELPPVVKLSVHGDPMFKVDGVSMHFTLTPNVLTPLLAWTAPGGSEMRLEGETYDLGQVPGDPDTPGQWFKRLKVTRNSADAVEVVAKKTHEGNMQVKVNGEIALLEQLRNEALGLGDRLQMLTHEKREGELNMTMGGLEFTVSTRRNLNHSLQDNDRPSAILHLNFKLTSALPKTASGLLAELASVKPMSKSTRLTLSHHDAAKLEKMYLQKVESA